MQEHNEMKINMKASLKVNEILEDDRPYSIKIIITKREDILQ